jgi:hypothetical protein
MADGTGNEEQRDALRRIGCDFGRGYLFTRPMPPEALADGGPRRPYPGPAGQLVAYPITSSIPLVRRLLSRLSAEGARLADRAGERGRCTSPPCIKSDQLR